ncbi:MAG: 2-amino-4-hydroxy-6-hydroxymethyldihydropteridine diphosphokinase [Pseudonocardiaceae bacterium]
MSAAVLSIGSNIGDRLEYLRGCITLLGDTVLGVSPVYSATPWGGVTQDEFLNAVVLVADQDADPLEWLRRGQCCETAARRTPGPRWGPRTLDVDVIDVDHIRQDDPRLTLPHPRAHQRAFVLVPWLDVAPHAVLAGRGAVTELVAALPPAERRSVRRRADLGLGSR